MTISHSDTARVKWPASAGNFLISGNLAMRDARTSATGALGGGKSARQEGSVGTDRKMTCGMHGLSCWTALCGVPPPQPQFPNWQIEVMRTGHTAWALDAKSNPLPNPCLGEVNCGLPSPRWVCFGGSEVVIEPSKLGLRIQGL